ncbi:hypothetical protein BDF21DRAFT_401893 [Thamnidium elegans]|nr:hypothetical protein BDF21DRAFT_401893 [Thamnidium elegans]
MLDEVLQVLNWDIFASFNNPRRSLHFQSPTPIMTSAGKKRNPPQRSNSQRERRKRSQRQPPFDAAWCLENLATLSLESFALHFGLTQKVKTTARYRNILNKYISDDHVTKNLLDNLKSWSDTANFVAFGKNEPEQQL